MVQSDFNKPDRDPESGQNAPHYIGSGSSAQRMQPDRGTFGRGFLAGLASSLGLAGVLGVFRSRWQRFLIQLGALCYVPAFLLATPPASYIIAGGALVWLLGYVKVRSVQDDQRLMRLYTAFATCHGFGMLALSLMTWNVENIVTAELISLTLAVVTSIGRPGDSGW